MKQFLCAAFLLMTAMLLLFSSCFAEEAAASAVTDGPAEEEELTEIEEEEVPLSSCAPENSMRSSVIRSLPMFAAIVLFVLLTTVLYEKGVLGAIGRRLKGLIHRQ